MPPLGDIPAIARDAPGAASARREQWLVAATAVTRGLLADAGADPLEMIARTVSDVADAVLVTVVLPTHDSRHVMVEVAVGAEELVGTTYAIDGSLCGQAITTGRAVLHDAGDGSGPSEWHDIPTIAHRIGTVVAVPMLGPDGARGALTICRPVGNSDYVTVDVEMARIFADHASVALELADGREQRYRVDILEDRARLAGDLHDNIIQRLFAAALRLEMISDGLADREVEAGIGDVVGSIRETIGELRTTITGLRRPTGTTTPTTLHRRVERVVEESTVLLLHRARLYVEGPLERVTDRVLADDVVAAVRELLSNTGRHAQATSVELHLKVRDDTVTVEVVDDGVGVGQPTRHSGLDSLTRRAQRHHGRFRTVDVHPGSDRPGTRATWTGGIGEP